MNKKDYNKLVNKTTLQCWLTINMVLFISYIIEIFKGLRSIEYVLIFSTVAFLPLLIVTIINKKQNGENLNIRNYFSVGYLIFYTFTLFTTQSILAFVYIIPMIFILVVYCDKGLVSKVYLYTIFINLIYIFIKFKSMDVNAGYFLELTLKEMVTYWEIQIACLALSGLFLYRTTNLIMIRESIIEELTDEVYTDSLTGLKNTRFLEENINKLFNYDKNENLCIAFIDIDNFKNFNTLYGHKFGDEVISSICEEIVKFTKEKSDVYGIRVGGDEFVIISKNLNRNDFIKMISDINEIIKNKKLLYNEKEVGICVSIGIATKKEDNEKTFFSLYNLADQRTGKAKEKGKNTIVY